MSYRKAKQCFSENKGASSTKTQPKDYNLNLGLLELTEALASDMAAIRSLLEQIVTALRNQTQR